MKIDLYTKGVLTVIAACLVYLCLGNSTHRRKQMCPFLCPQVVFPLGSSRDV